MITKKELIDFLNSVDKYFNLLNDEFIEMYADNYLKSINSNESDELRAVGNNEQTKEDFIQGCPNNEVNKDNCDYRV